MSGDPLKRSPLDEAHRALGAKMVGFGGWDMPLQYPDGTIAEHMACRTGSVAFDVSHLGTVRVSGAGSFDLLQEVLSNDLRKIEPGRAQYSHVLDPLDASVLDDVIVWWLDADLFDVMPNASNTDRVTSALEESATGQEITDTTGTRGVIAVQGPLAREHLGDFWPEAASVGRFRVKETSWEGTACTVAGTGYTGEDGVEIAAPADVVSSIWAGLVDHQVTPAGLGARDTLRLEAALPLHGHELGPGISTLQAQLGWVLGWDKASFRGRGPAAAELERGPVRILRGIATDGRKPPRQGQVVLLDDQPVGEVTSGNYSPVLGHGIAFALVAPEVGEGTAIEVDSRGTLLPGRVVPTPFVGRP